MSTPLVPETRTGSLLHAPTGVAAVLDQRYGDEPDARFDVFHPEEVTDALPLLLWVHGGGWVGGSRSELTDTRSRNWSVTDNLTRAFPPALITVGNADPLRAHSELLATRLDALGVTVETVFFSAEHKPALGHEYQFNLDIPEARQFLARQREFLRRQVSGARP